MSRIVCIGDSLTWGFPFGPAVSWVNRIAEETEHEVINRGVNGHTTTDMVRRFPREVLEARPTHVVIMGGTNDVVWRESHDRIVWNLRHMVEEARAAGIRVILGLPIPIDEPEMERRLERVRQWMRAYAAEQGLDLIDFDACMRGPHGEMRQELFLDGAHPSREGWAAMAEAVDLSVFE
ncbi:MAG: SGNH/GDSL hydrolase family protein [Syntrophomonadaceae bacterium]|nr:SGNH/GDSL hydrolase family protein [Syntrophomonadaceae bacterium]